MLASVAVNFRITQVVDGVGEMVVTEVGDSTQLGQIAKRRLVLGVAHQRQVIDDKSQTWVPFGETAECGQQSGDRDHCREVVALGAYDFIPRYSWFLAGSLGVMYGGFPTTA